MREQGAPVRSLMMVEVTEAAALSFSSVGTKQRIGGTCKQDQEIHLRTNICTAGESTGSARTRMQVATEK